MRGQMRSTVILISCPDQPGIIAKITSLIYSANGNILTLEQHTEAPDLFFMRIHADISNLNMPLTQLKTKFKEITSKMQANYSWHDPQKKPRVAVLVTEEYTCLHDLLLKQKSGQLNCEIPLVISNHDVLKPIAKNYGVPFHHVPKDPNNAAKHEDEVLRLLRSEKIDLVVLARYMHILSNDFVSQFPQRIINIHHGFLPAFKGGRAYHQAWDRGVKIIGATAHYATAELDEGPIITQGV